MAKTQQPKMVQAGWGNRARFIVNGLCCWPAILFVSMASLAAHDSPEDVIAALTQKMDEEGKSAAVLYQRGVEHRVLGELTAASADLKEAVSMDSTFIAARAEWAKVLLDQGAVEKALRTVNAGLRQTDEKHAVATLLHVRAEIQANQGNLEQALADCAQALQAHPEDLDGYLLRGRLQSQLSRYEEAATGLNDGYVRTGSVVLKNHWIEALIDANECSQAISEIEIELAQSRWKSSWLLRRARARLCLRARSAAVLDLHAAIEEIDTRLNPRHPDVTLLADRGLARALLGETDHAREDLREAQTLGADAWVLERLKKTLEEIDADWVDNSSTKDK